MNIKKLIPTPFNNNTFIFNSVDYYCHHFKCMIFLTTPYQGTYVDGRPPLKFACRPGLTYISRLGLKTRRNNTITCILLIHGIHSNKIFFLFFFLGKLLSPNERYNGGEFYSIIIFDGLKIWDYFYFW